MTDEEFLQPGRSFNGFQLIERLGEGAMGAVWKATHLKLRRPVAIKFMKREAAKSENARNRFLREGEAAARVDHENVVKVHDVGVANEAMPYIVMELLDGEELRRRFRTVGPMPVTELVDLMLPVCAAVAAAHDEGIVHRDLKPENIFLARTRDRVVMPKVVDFGISRVSDDVSGRVNTATAAVMGTPRYMSPEQVQGAKHTDVHSDQYALGVILYEGVTGEPPFDDTVLFKLMGKIVAGNCRPPRSLRPDLPEGFEAVVLRAMSVYAERRFPSVRSLAQALLPFASERMRHMYSDRFIEVTSTIPEAPSPIALIPPAVPPSGVAFAPVTDAPSLRGVSPSAAPVVTPSTMHTTLGESARELPAHPPNPPERRPGAVVVAGLLALGLSVAAGVVVVARTPASSSTPVNTATTAHSAALARATPAAAAPLQTPPALVVPPQVAAPPPSGVPSSPVAAAPVVATPIAAPPVAAAPPVSLHTQSRVAVGAPDPHAPLSRERVRRVVTARPPLSHTPSNVAPVTAPPTGTTAGGAPID